MIRVTTPKHTFTFGTTNPETEYKTILITYAQNGENVLEKGKDDLTFDTETVGGETTYVGWFRLTQEETKGFSAKPGATVTIQVRALTQADEALASDKWSVRVTDVLNDEVLT